MEPRRQHAEAKAFTRHRTHPGPDRKTHERLTPAVARKARGGIRVDDRKPERGEAQGGIGRRGAGNRATAERIARRDEAQEPRPELTDGSRLQSEWVEGSRTTRRQHRMLQRVGNERRENGRWVRAVETPRYLRAGATPRRVEPQERRRLPLRGGSRPGRAMARAGSGTPAASERRCMTRPSRRPNRDGWGAMAVTAGAGGKPQGRRAVPPRFPNGRIACEGCGRIAPAGARGETDLNAAAGSSGCRQHRTARRDQ